MGARRLLVALLVSVGCSDAHLNAPPVLADFTIEATEDTPISVTVDATDPEDDPLLIELATAPSHGTADVSGATLTYTPEADYNGDDSLTVTVYDKKNPKVTAAVTITVAPGNDAPVGVNDIIAASEDAPRTVAASALLANDTDLDGDTLSITAVSAPTNGTVALSGANVVFTPAANFNGTASFQYTLSDGMATATVDVEVDVGGANDAPVAMDDVATTAEDTPIDITNLLANDTDADAQVLNVQSALAGTGGTVSQSGDTVTFTPTANFNGTATFTYVVTDGVASDTGSVTVTVTAVNDPPVANDDSGNTSEDIQVTFTTLTTNDTDVDGNTLTVSAVANPVNGTVILNGGQPKFTPDANYSGSASFEYTVSDGAGGTDTGLVTITIDPVNDPPVAFDDVGTTPEDTAITFTNLVSNDTDVEGDTLTVTAVSGATNGTVSLNGGSPIFTPNANFNGTASFTYTVNDGQGDTDLGTVTITVTPVTDITQVAPSTLQLLASGGTAILRVDVDSPSTSDLVIDLVSSSPPNIAVPTTVTLPAGKTSVTFRARADATTATSAISLDATLSGTTSSASASATVVTSASAPGTLDLVLNEVNYDIDTAANSDANCDTVSDAQDDEFFEVSNRSSSPVQMSGVSFWDLAAFGAGAPGTPGFTFPSFVLGPGEVAVVFSGLVGTTGTSVWCTNLDGSHIGDARAFGASRSFALNNTGDTVHLTATANNTSTELVPAVTLPSGSKQAFVRNPDFTGVFVKDGLGIGASDRFWSPGTLVTGQPFAAASPP